MLTSFSSNFWLINVCVVTAVCILFAGVLIPQILLISFRRKLFDEPDERKIHLGAVPRLGGIAFKPVVFFSVALLLGIDIILGFGPMLEGIEAECKTLIFGFCSIMLLYLVGMADDLIGIKYRAKFFVQTVCGIMMIAGGVWINDLHGIILLDEIPTWLGFPLTVFTVIFIINAINLIDGIDGLASGLCAVAAFAYGCIFFLEQKFIYSMLSFATLGVLVPFFYFNVFGDVKRRKKIFMGDTGSLTIGMMLCLLSVKLLQCDLSSMAPANPFILAFSPLAIPCFDVVRVYLHRVRNGKNPFLPDRNHIHHKLLDLGMNQHLAMVSIISFSVFFILCNIFLSQYIDATLLIVADVAVWTLINVWLRKKINEKK